MKTILITASTLSPVGIDTILSLKDFYRIICADVKSRNESISYYFCKQYYEVPLAKEATEYIDKIAKICDKEKVDIILPLTIEEIFVLLTNNDFFANKGIRIANGNDLDIITTCSDKWLTNKFLRNRGIHVPNAIPVFNTSDIKNNIEKLGYPEKRVVIKPRVTHGSRGFKIITSKESDLSLIIDTKPNDFHFINQDYFCDVLKNKNIRMLLMDYLEGDDYSVYIFCINGKPRIILPMKRLGLIPGMSTGGVLEKNEGIMSYVKEISRAFKFNGAVNLQLKDTPAGPLLYEINTRISATTVITRGTDINFPLCEALLSEGKDGHVDEHISRATILWGLKLHRIHREIYQYGDTFYEK
ncbi:MAG: ATP-grasp domain-containing protein [Candidatus Roizmanbacteria bacterium]|nr:ATP-grasp domain-containing protein [Candidatus Roizmanbacteria bacterium]